MKCEFGWVGWGGGWQDRGGVQSHNLIKPNSVELS